MAYRIVPFQFGDNPPSSVVFFLCDGDETPLDKFLIKSRNKEAFAKFVRQLVSISKYGFSKSMEVGKIRPLKSDKRNDLCEVYINGVAARGFSYVINNRQAIVIDFFGDVHRGKDGKRDTQKGIDQLINHWPRLLEALEEGESDGKR